MTALDPPPVLQPPAEDDRDDVADGQVLGRTTHAAGVLVLRGIAGTGAVLSGDDLGPQGDVVPASVLT